MHEKEIYFSKIIFVQHRYSGNTYIQINLQEHEFSVQSFTYSLDPRAKYEMPRTVYVSKESKIDLISPAVKISHGKMALYQLLSLKNVKKSVLFHTDLKLKRI